MGCVCGKSSSAVKDSDDSPKQRESMRKTSDLRMPRRIVSRRQESFGVREKVENGELDRKVNGSRKVREDYFEKEKETCEVISNFPGIGSVPKAVEGEQVAAGWPTWLVAVAGEAIKGWIPRKADTFEKLDKIGQGTYSSVYKGRDLISNKFVALKKIRFDNKDPESVKFMAREILILRKLDHPNVIKLEGLVTSVTSSSLYLVFEYMEHDLTGIASLPGVKFTEPQVKCYMQQLLRGLEYCHSHGVLHRDIKGSNLLIDNNGILKIADFGLASYFDNSLSVPLTSRVVTLWYRPPELLLGATHYGVAVDLWSAGCILGELYTGKPIMPGRTEVEQLHKIFKLCGSPSEEYWRKSKLPHTTVFKPTHPYRQQIAGTMKDLPYAAVQMMETLLAVDPSDRGTADSALKSEFFNTHPFACDPSSLPKYPPSKEIDAKFREEEKRRRGTAVGMKGQKCENDLKRSKELRAAPAPDANAELPRSMQQRRQGHPNPKSRSEYFNAYNDEEVVGSRPLKETSISYQRDAVHHSGPLAPGVGWRKHEDVSSRNDLSGPTSRAFSSSGSRDNLVSESFGDPMRKQDKRRHTQIFSGLQHLPSGKVSTREHYIDGHKEKKINFSGPLGPSSNVEQILREHDRRIQEVARRLKHDKARAGRVRPQEIASYVSN